MHCAGSEGIDLLASCDGEASREAHVAVDEDDDAASGFITVEVFAESFAMDLRCSTNASNFPFA